MADYKVTDTELTSIANAIRAKTGKSDQIEFPTEFVSEIGSISDNGNTYAFIKAVGVITKVTNGTIEITPEAVGAMNVFAIPEPSSDSELWSLLDSNDTMRGTISIFEYGQVEVFQGELLVPTLSSLNGSNGHVIYNTNISYNWSSAGDVWKAFDRNKSNNGQYKSENQSNMWIGYVFTQSQLVTKVVFYGGNYSQNNDFQIIVEYTLDGEQWTEVERFNQYGNIRTPFETEINDTILGVRWRSPTQKTAGTNLFIYELEVYGIE